ncbi:methyltransferase domain-containing protein [Microvirga sp. HBU67558]|uniref:class I SAM-dependent methyltransferase n=1 Tax=Microvirga TaxID=186650 RepID=UPI001B37E381|nr:MULTISPECIES: methyltransferase domain-containing protein [unclassified Microvirga]MBQ0821519.1 methyltransferase domain-containing protein [Microvirga sp. HBU67558]
MTETKTSFRDFEHQGWSDHEVATTYHGLFSPLTVQAIGALLDATGVRPGTRVADVATGPGYVAAAAAERGAEVVGIDFSSTQLALARQLYPDIEFRHGDAGALPLPDDSFDAVISNFGIPHFPDPDAFLREAYRVLRHTGRVAFSTWASPQECVGFGWIYSAVQAHGRMDVPLPPGPNFFPFGDPAQCERSLQAAGFGSVTVTKVPQVWRVVPPDAPFDILLKGTVRAADLLRAQTPEALAAIRDAVRQGVAAHARDGAFECWT